MLCVDRGLCDELITRPEEYYGLRCVIFCDMENSKIKKPWPAFGKTAEGNKMLTRGRKNFIKNIGLGWLTFRAPEAGGCVELILL